MVTDLMQKLRDIAYTLGRRNVPLEVATVVLVKSEAYAELLQTGKTEEDVCQGIAEILETNYLLGLARYQKEQHDTLLANALDLEKSDKFLEAVDLYEKVINLNPSNSNAYLHMGHCLRSLQKYQASLAAYEKFLMLCPNDLSGLEAKAKAESEGGMLAQAAATYRAAIRVSESQPDKTQAVSATRELRLNLSDVLLRQDKWQEALFELDIILAQVSHASRTTSEKQLAAKLLGLKAFALVKLANHESAMDCHLAASKLWRDYLTLLPAERSKFLSDIGLVRAVIINAKRLWKAARQKKASGILPLAALLGATLLFSTNVALLILANKTSVWLLAAGVLCLFALITSLLALDLRRVLETRTVLGFLSAAALVGALYLDIGGLWPTKVQCRHQIPCTHFEEVTEAVPCQHFRLVSEKIPCQHAIVEETQVPCKHSYIQKRQIPCTHFYTAFRKVGCQHAIPCSHRGPCQHISPCVHTCFYRGRRQPCHLFDRLHDSDPLHKYDLQHPDGDEVPYQATQHAFDIQDVVSYEHKFDIETRQTTAHEYDIRETQVPIHPYDVHTVKRPKHEYDLEHEYDVVRKIF